MPREGGEATQFFSLPSVCGAVESVLGCFSSFSLQSPLPPTPHPHSPPPPVDQRLVAVASSISAVGGVPARGHPVLGQPSVGSHAALLGYLLGLGGWGGGGRGHPGLGQPSVGSHAALLSIWLSSLPVTTQRLGKGPRPPGFVQCPEKPYGLLGTGRLWGGRDICRASCPGMSVDILWKNCDQCLSTVQCCFTSTETVRLIRTENPGRPPRLSHSS